MKRIICVVLFLAVIVTGCGQKSEDNQTSAPPTSTVASENDADGDNVLDNIVSGDSKVKVENIGIESIFSLFRDEKALCLNIKNESDYNLLGVTVRYKIKDDATNSQLKAFEEYKEWRDISYDELKDVDITATYDSMIKQNEKKDNIPLLIGGQYKVIQNEKQADLIKLDSMELAYIDFDDNMIHGKYYDAISGSYSEPYDSKPIFDWPVDKLGSILPQPEKEVVVNLANRDDDFKFITYDCDKTFFESYVDACKKNGFTEDVEVDSDKEYKAYYSGDKKKKLHVLYYESESALKAYVYIPSN